MEIDEIDEIAGFGSQALATANACFQASLDQARFWKKQAREHKKATKALKARVKDLQIKHMEQEELLRSFAADPRILSSTRSLLRGEPAEASDDETSF